MTTKQEASTKHTPGPWEVRSPANDSRAFDVYAGHTKLHHGHWGGEADARLIAAAPELLKAAVIGLSWLQNAVDDGTHADRAKADLERIRAAIAKASK